MSTSATAAEIIKAYPAAAPIADRMVAFAAQIGADPRWLANVIQFESAWNPQAVNRVTGATGLIQWMPKTAAELGTTLGALSRMSVAEQWPFVEKYFLLPRIPKPLTSQLDVFMAVFYPAAVGKGSTFAFSDAVRAANPGINTAADYLRFALSHAKL